MLRLKANKTSLYKLTAGYAALPGIRRVIFWKAFRRPDYFLDWTQENGCAQAVFCACAGRPMISVTVRDINGHQISREIYRPALEDLRERGMLEELRAAPAICPGGCLRSFADPAPHCHGCAFRCFGESAARE